MLLKSNNYQEILLRLLFVVIQLDKRIIVRNILAGDSKIGGSSSREERVKCTTTIPFSGAKPTKGNDLTRQLKKIFFLSIFIEESQGYYFIVPALPQVELS